MIPEPTRSHVLQVDHRGALPEPLDHGDRGDAGVVGPEGIDLQIDERRVGPGHDQVVEGGVAERGELEGVVVVGEAQPRVAAERAPAVEPLDDVPGPPGVLAVLGRQGGDDGVLAAEGAQLGDHLGGARLELGERDVRAHRAQVALG
jgi:hypothetical protein